MSALVRFACDRPRLTLLLILAATALLSPGLRFSKTRPILEGELPSSDPLVQQTDLFDERHPDLDFYVIGVESRSAEGIWNPRTLAKIAELSDAAADLPGALGSVQSLATWKHVTGHADSIEIRDLMPDPSPDMEEVARIRAIVEDDPLLHGRLVSMRGDMALVRVGFLDGTTPEQIHGGLEELRSDFREPEVIAIYGREHANVEITKAVNRNIGLLLPIAIGLLLLFLYFCFGRWQAVWVPVAVFIVTVVSFLGAVGLLGIARTVLSSTVPVLLIVSLGSYLIHFLRRVYEEALRSSWPEAVRIAAERTASPIALCAVTTAAGFSSLSVFQIYSVREFGLLSAGGALIAAFVSIVCMPALLLSFSKKSPREYSLGRRWMTPLVDLLVGVFVSAAGSRRTFSRTFAVAVAVLSIVGASYLQVGSNPPEFFPRGHPVRDGFESLVENFGGDGFLFVEVSAPTSVYEPDFLSRLSSFQGDAGQIDRVVYASSLVDKVLMRVNRKMNGDLAEFEVVPETRAMAAQFAAFYEWSAGDVFAELVDDVADPKRVVVDIFAHVNDSALVTSMVSSLRGALDRNFPDATTGEAILGGQRVLWIAQNRYIVIGKILNIGSSIVLVGIVCFLALKSWRAAIASVVPAGLAALTTFGVMGALGIRLDLASCVITAIVIGIGVDFAIHFCWRHEEVLAAHPDLEPRLALDRAIRLAAPAILLDGVSNAVAFSVCLLAVIVPVRDFGWLICLSMISCTLASLGLLPGLVAGQSAAAESDRRSAVSE